MTDVGRRPTLHELLLALHAIKHIHADRRTLDPEAEEFAVELIFTRAECPGDWIEGQPKPQWMFEQLIEELAAWLSQRNREEQWVSKEERMGSSIDTLMAHWTEKLKKAAETPFENIATRMEKRVLQDTVLRLKELQERRNAGGVYTHVGSKREKARKQWEEDEYEGPKREEEQRRARAKMNREQWFEDRFRQTAEDLFGASFKDTFFGADWANANPPPRNNANKRPWHETLGVPVTASKGEIKKAYRRLAAKFHPDRYKEPDGHAKMAEINTARDEGLGGL
jgi:hypothetical protein